VRFSAGSATMALTGMREPLQRQAITSSPWTLPSTRPQVFLREPAHPDASGHRGARGLPMSSGRSSWQVPMGRDLRPGELTLFGLEGERSLRNGSHLTSRVASDSSASCPKSARDRFPDHGARDLRKNTREYTGLQEPIGPGQDSPGYGRHSQILDGHSWTSSSCGCRMALLWESAGPGLSRFETCGVSRTANVQAHSPH
jgi:hypothetical protein